MVKIKWLGHACFKICFDDIQYVIDPFEDEYVPSYDNICTSADMVFTSHNHNDHAGIMGVKCMRRLTYGVNVITVKTYHDEQKGALRGVNIVHIFEYKGKRIAHFGDIGHILTEEQKSKIGKIDVALIPIGDVYTVGAEKAKIIAEQVDAKVVIPMHYRCEEFGFKELDTADLFESLYSKVKHIDTNEYIVEENPLYDIVILKYERGNNQ